MIIAKIIFIISAVVISTITASHMLNIHGAKAYLEELEESKKTSPKRILRAQKELCHDYILNFIGTLLGWLSAYYFIFYRIGNKIEIADLIVIFIAFVGITGYLPHIVINKGFKP